MNTCNTCRFAIFKNNTLWCNVHNQQTHKLATCQSHKPEDPPEELPPSNSQFPGTWVRIPDQKACMIEIRQWMQRTGTTQYALGKKAGLSKTMTSFIFTKRRPLTTNTATKIYNIMAGKE